MSIHDIDTQINLVEQQIISTRRVLTKQVKRLNTLQEMEASSPHNIDPAIRLEIDDLQDEKIPRTQQALAQFQEDLRRLKEQRELPPPPSPPPPWPTPPPPWPTPPQRTPARAIASIVAWLTLLAGIVVVDVLILYPRLKAPVSYTHKIDSAFHHLGDNVYDQMYVKGIAGDRIHNLNPEGTNYVRSFDLLAIRRAAGVSSGIALKRAELSMYVNSLKPRHTAPAVLGLNDQFVAYLNDYVTREEFRRVPVSVLLDVPIHEGQNEIAIFVGPDTEENGGDTDVFEDFEFDSLMLHVEFDAARLRVWPLLGYLVLETALLAVAYLVLMKETRAGYRSQRT